MYLWRNENKRRDIVIVLPPSDRLRLRSVYRFLLQTCCALRPKLLELSEIWLMAERLIPVSSRPFQGKQVPAPIYSDVKSEEKRENTAEWWSRRWVTGHVYGNATGRLLCLYYVFVASKSGILISCQLTPTCEGWTDVGFDWGWHFAIKLWTNLLNPFTEKLPLKARSGRQPSTLWTWWRIKTK